MGGESLRLADAVVGRVAMVACPPGAGPALWSIGGNQQCPPREALARLLKLNHERYAEEVRQGLHDKKGKAKATKAGRGRKSKASSGGATLFGVGEDDL